MIRRGRGKLAAAASQRRGGDGFGGMETSRRRGGRNLREPLVKMKVALTKAELTRAALTRAAWIKAALTKAAVTKVAAGEGVEQAESMDV